MNDKLVVFPGSFDPVTQGHVDLIKRGAALFGSLTVAVLVNNQKNALFTPAERVELLRKALADVSGVTVEQFDGLLADFLKARGARVVLRGVRAAADLEAENRNHWYNSRLLPGLETVYLPAGEEYAYVSSSSVKELYAHGGHLPGLLPEPVAEKLKEKFSK